MKKKIINTIIAVLIQSMVLVNCTFCADILPQKKEALDCLSPSLTINSSFLQYTYLQLSEHVAESIVNNISEIISRPKLLSDTKERIEIILKYGPYDMREIQRLNTLLKIWLPKSNWPEDVSQEIANFLIILFDLSEDDLRNYFRGKMHEYVLKPAWAGDFNDKAEFKLASEGYNVPSPLSQWIRTYDFKLDKDDILIDLLCGNGEKTAAIAARYPQAKVYGWDLYAPNIVQAIKTVKLKKLKNIEFSIHNVCQINNKIRDNSVSAVTLLYMPTYNFSLNDKTAVFRHILRMLKIGGRVYFDYDYDNSLQNNNEANYLRAVDFFIDLAQQEDVKIKKTRIAEDHFIIEILSKPIGVNKNFGLFDNREQYILYSLKQKEGIEILEELYPGKNASVYIIRHPVYGKAAIKILSYETGKDYGVEERFEIAKFLYNKYSDISPAPRPYKFIPFKEVGKCVFIQSLHDNYDLREVKQILAKKGLASYQIGNMVKFLELISLMRIWVTSLKMPGYQGLVISDIVEDDKRYLKVDGQWIVKILDTEERQYILNISDMKKFYSQIEYDYPPALIEKALDYVLKQEKLNLQQNINKEKINKKIAISSQFKAVEMSI